MQKRMKIISTVASLVLAVALMAFGVYAASNITFNINSTVSYKFTDALIKVTRTISSANIAIPPSSDADLSALDYINAVSASFQTYNMNNEWVDPAIPDGFAGGEYNADIISEDLNYNFNVSYAFKIEVSVETKNTNGVSFSYTLPTTPENGNYRIFADLSNIESGTTVIPASGPATVIYYIALVDTTVEIADENIISSFIFAKM